MNDIPFTSKSYRHRSIIISASVGSRCQTDARMILAMMDQSYSLVSVIVVASHAKQQPEHRQVEERSAFLSDHWQKPHL